MKRQQVKEFLQEGVKSLNNVSFGYGRISEMNSKRNQAYPLAWLESLRVTTSFSNIVQAYNDWEVRIHIVKLDKADSNEEQYEHLVDECDELAQKLAYLYNNKINLSNDVTYKLVTISNIVREPRIKRNADNTTGVTLSFTLTAPDTTYLC